ncbi:MAG TPA: GNAT family N-acetyltransferase [Alphaproteobacteria bacterium]|nr:GNAT family N-acetyltransferase [Alphaproteobacteria bacterium]
MPDAPAIRRAAPSESEALCALLHAAFGAYRGVLVPESGALRETPASIAERLAREHVLVAGAEGAPVATVTVERPAPGAVYLGRLAVHPDWQRRGLAERMITAGEAMARAEGAAVLALDVRLCLPGNIRLFERLGFREARRMAHPGFTEPTFMRMEKRLAGGASEAGASAGLGRGGGEA